MSGKGSKQRPTDREKFSSGWDLAFGKNVKEIEADLVARSLPRWFVFWTRKEKQMKVSRSTNDSIGNLKHCRQND